MNFIRRKAFFLNYLGALLFILSTFVPIIKIENQTVAFIDQFLYLSIALGIFSTLIIIFTTLKQYKLTLIPTILNIVIVAFGIYNILTIENLKVSINLSLSSYGIAFILYPIAALLSILGALLTKKHNIDNKKAEITESINETLTHVEETPQNWKENDNDEVLLDDIEQIPLSNIIQQNNMDVPNSDENESDIHNDNQILELNNELIVDDQSIIDKVNNDDEKVNVENYNNELLDIEENLDDISYFEEFNSDNTNNENFEIEQNINENNLNSIDESNTANNSLITEDINLTENTQNENNEIAEVHISNLTDDDLITPEESSNNEFTNIAENNNEDIVFEDIIEKNSKPENSLIKASDYEPEVPDISMDDNFMTNNIQVEEQPKQEFMALNPSDIKVEEKMPVFKKKEKNEEDPLEKLLKRNIPMSLGRTCQFCNTPLGDDERICPICGRIN